jgi:aspartyl-tRNA synthetase
MAVHHRLSNGKATVLHTPGTRPAGYSNSFDLLFRGMEIVTGGQRLHRYEDYVAALAGNTPPYEGYLQAFRYGMPPHGGFALGLERWVARLVGARNVRETTLSRVISTGSLRSRIGDAELSPVRRRERPTFLRPVHRCG